MVQLFHLIGDGGGECLVVVSKCTCGYTGYKIQVGFASVVGEDAALAGGEGDGITAVGFVDA